MVEKTNKYGFIHGGFSFYNLDTRAHNLAIENIGESMTSHASIYYHKTIAVEEINTIVYNVNVISKTISSISIEGKIYKGDEVCITCFFTFVKIKSA